MAEAVKFSAYPFAQLPRMTRREAQLISALVRWLPGARLHRGAIETSGSPGPSDAERRGAASDRYAASCELRAFGVAIDVRGSSTTVRAHAQRLLGGPAELAAPRPLGAVERAIWALVVAQAIERLGIAGEVWPRVDEPPPPDGIAIEWPSLAAVAYVPRELELHAPPVREVPAWDVDAVVVVARCALPRHAVAALAVRDVVVVERRLELEILAGTLGLAARQNEVEARVVSGYVPRPMALPDDAHVELTVALGTTRLPLRDVIGLAVGQIVSLGRPLAGPFEVRALGRMIGRGELVDVDGELGVRIVSLGD